MERGTVDVYEQRAADWRAHRPPRYSEQATAFANAYRRFQVGKRVRFAAVEVKGDVVRVVEAPDEDTFAPLR